MPSTLGKAFGQAAKGFRRLKAHKHLPNGLQEKVDTVKALQTETAAGLDAMLLAILDKAFKGEM